MLTVGVHQVDTSHLPPDTLNEIMVWLTDVHREATGETDQPTFLEAEVYGYSLGTDGYIIEYSVLAAEEEMPLLSRAYYVRTNIPAPGYITARL